MNTVLPDGRRGKILALGLTISVLGGVWAAVVSPLMTLYSDRSDRLAERETLARRMATIVATLPSLQNEAATATAAGPATTALLLGETDSIAAARLQETIQTMATKAGTNLTSLETLPPDASGVYHRIHLRVALNAPYPVIVGLLEAIESSAPRLLIDDVRLSGSRIVGRATVSPLDATLTVIAFRAASPATAGTASPSPPQQGGTR